MAVGSMMTMEVQTRGVYVVENGLTKGIKKGLMVTIMMR